MSVSIAIDGPSGAGKSTLAKNLAKELGYIYIDTGAMYRAVGYYLSEKGILSTDIRAVADNLEDIFIEIKYIDETQHIFLNGEDVTIKIRTQEASNNASIFSTIKQVRQKLVKLQQELSKECNIVMDGRDIGTVVLPNADIKIFLTASVTERAYRRQKELQQINNDTNIEKIIAEIKERDRRDTTREESPLKMAEDAILLDSAGMNEKELLNQAIAIVKKGKK